MSGTSNCSQLKEVDVDYITATCHQTGTTSPLVSFGRWVVSEEISRGGKDSAWRSTGYHGRHAGSAVFGVSNQGGIVRLSSHCAQQYWAQLLHLADNVTRLDVQVTVLPVAGTQATLSRHHKELLKAPRYRGKPAKFKVWYGPIGPEAVIVGRRVSDRFGRIYDKGLESQLAEYCGCLRYEVELHRQVAFRTALQLDSQENEQGLMLAIVSEFMRNRGLKSGLWRRQPAELDVCEQPLAYSRQIVDASKRSTPELTKALRWMTNSVQPAVKRLIESGHRDLVLQALGLSTESQVVEASYSQTWPNFDKWR